MIIYLNESAWVSPWFKRKGGGVGEGIQDREAEIIQLNIKFIF